MGRMKDPFSLLAVALLGAALAVPSQAAANDGPPAGVWWLMAEQQAQDVRLSFGISPKDAVTSFSVSRESTDGGEEVDLDLVAGENLVATGEEETESCAYYWGVPGSVDYETLCLSHPELCVDCDDDQQPDCYQSCEECPEWVPCNEVPEVCTDCDGDDEPECAGGCEPATTWEVTDACVPPGGYVYSVIADNAVGTDTGTVEITVEDVDFAACSDDPGSDGDTDADADAESDADEADNGGCSVTGRAGFDGLRRDGLLALFGALISFG